MLGTFKFVSCVFLVQNFKKPAQQFNVSFIQINLDEIIFKIPVTKYKFDNLPENIILYLKMYTINM